jgi:hypothetical protein
MVFKGSALLTRSRTNSSPFIAFCSSPRCYARGCAIVTCGLSYRTISAAAPLLRSAIPTAIWRAAMDGCWKRRALRHARSPPPTRLANGPNDRTPSIGQLNKALDEAIGRGWAVVDMKNDWRRIFPFEQEAPLSYDS